MWMECDIFTTVVTGDDGQQQKQYPFTWYGTECKEEKEMSANQFVVFVHPKFESFSQKKENLISEIRKRVIQLIKL